MTELFAGLLGAAWLVPNHYLPWLVAWGDAIAIVGLLLLLHSVMFIAVSGAHIAWQLAGVASVSAFMLLAQFGTGKLLFGGDALIAALYVGLWLAAVLAGRLLVGSSRLSSGLNAAMAAWLIAALLSVGIALVQCTGVLSLGIYAADMPPGGRPFANLAQPNNFSTVCFIGLCGLLWLHQLRRVSGAAFALAVGFLLLGMVLSQSRTSWLQMGLLMAWGLALGTRANLRISRAQLLLLGTVYVAGVLLWPLITDALLLPAGRSVDEQMRAGMRLPYWRAMLDAIGREPLTGYGWQQVGLRTATRGAGSPSHWGLFRARSQPGIGLPAVERHPCREPYRHGVGVVVIAHIRALRCARGLDAGNGSAVVAHSMLDVPLEHRLLFDTWGRQRVRSMGFRLAPCSTAATTFATCLQPALGTSVNSWVCGPGTVLAKFLPGSCRAV